MVHGAQGSYIGIYLQTIAMSVALGSRLHWLFRPSRLLMVNEGAGLVVLELHDIVSPFNIIRHRIPLANLSCGFLKSSGVGFVRVVVWASGSSVGGCQASVAPYMY